MCEDKVICFSEDCPLKEHPLDRLVMRQNSLELIDTLANMLGIAGDESTEARWNDELYQRRVLRAAVRALDRAWNGA